MIVHWLGVSLLALFYSISGTVPSVDVHLESYSFFVKENTPFVRKSDITKS